MAVWARRAARCLGLAVLLAWLGFGAQGHVAKAQRGAMSCSILASVGPSFGAYDTLSTTPTDSVGRVDFRCQSVGAAAIVAIELGGSHGGGRRAMKNRGDRLEYELYLDAARSQVWGDGTRGTVRYLARPPEGLTVSLPIYGRIPPRQLVRIGAYSDQIHLTFQY